MIADLAKRILRHYGLRHQKSKNHRRIGGADSGSAKRYFIRK